MLRRGNFTLVIPPFVVFVVLLLFFNLVNFAHDERTQCERMYLVNKSDAWCVGNRVIIDALDNCGDLANSLQLTIRGLHDAIEDLRARLSNGV